MKLPQTGGCLCGRIRYEISEAPKLIYTCHCIDCQHLSSSAFSMAMIVPSGAFRLLGDQLRPIRSTTDSGRVKVRWVCPHCACWVFNTNTQNADLRNVRCGTLDDTSWPRPTVHFWTRSKQPWVRLPEADQTFETEPPVD
jgi:hypothetical protein